MTTNPLLIFSIYLFHNTELHMRFISNKINLLREKLKLIANRILKINLFQAIVKIVFLTNQFHLKNEFLHKKYKILINRLNKLYLDI